MNEIPKPLQGCARRIAFAGTPQFAVPTLDALVKNHYDICAVLTQPDRASGRGQHVHASPVKCYALQHQLPILQYQTLRTQDAEDALRALDIDILVVVAYGLILPKNILTIPRFGCLNVHASLLPRGRGAAPIQHTILHGDALTGISIMHMDEGLDTGPVYFQAPYVVSANTTAAKLHDDLAQLGAQSLLHTLHVLTRTAHQYVAKPQQSQLATYAEKIKKGDGCIHWQKSAEEILRQIYAYQPWPSAYTYLDHQIIKIFEATIITVPSDVNLPAGTIIKHTKMEIFVACGQNVLALSMLQMPNKKPLSVAALLNAQAEFFAVGKRFEEPPV